MTDEDGVIVLGARLAAARTAEERHVPAGPSPIAGVEYPRGSGDLWRWSERSQDAALSTFVESYMQTGKSERAKSRSSLSAADLYTLLLFARRRAFAAIRSPDRGAVIEAFNALATIDVERVDPDDVAMEAILAAYAAPGAGITARIAASRAIRHADPEVAEILAEIAEDDEIDLADALGHRVVATPDGPVVLGDESERYEPERDLAAVILATAAAIEAEGTYLVEDVGVADVLRVIWVRPSGTEDPQVSAALESVTGCASLHGHPVEYREGGHSLMGWLAEAGTDEAAVVIADGANRAGDAHTAILGIPSGRLVLVLVAAGRPSFETRQTMARFQQLQDLLR